MASWTAQEPDLMRHDEHHDLNIVSYEVLAHFWWGCTQALRKDGRIVLLELENKRFRQYKLHFFSVFSAEARTFLSKMFRSLRTEDLEVVAVNFARTRPENKHIHVLSIHDVRNCHMNSFEKKHI